MASVAAAASLGFLAALLAPQGFDLSALVNAGSNHVEQAALPPGLTVSRPGDGYDGQYAYTLALNPLTTERSAHGIALDMPAYRQQRILYPALAWTLSLGQAPLVPAALAVINVAAMGALAWAAARYAGLRGRSTLWGLALALLPSSFIALANDLCEVLLAVFLVAAALALERGRPRLMTVALCLAVLAHEHGVILALALAVVTVAAPELRFRGWWWTWLVPLTIFVVWQVYLTSVWGESPIRVAMAYLNEPLRGLVSIARRIVPPRSPSEVLHLCAFGYSLLFSASCVWALRTTATHRAVCLAWAFASTVLFLGTGLVWEAELSLWRAAVAPLTLGSLVLLGSRARVAPVMLFLGAGFGLLMAARLVWIAWHG